MGAMRRGVTTRMSATDPERSSTPCTCTGHYSAGESTGYEGDAAVLSLEAGNDDNERCSATPLATGDEWPCVGDADMAGCSGDGQVCRACAADDAETSLSRGDEFSELDQSISVGSLDSLSVSIGKGVRSGDSKANRAFDSDGNDGRRLSTSVSTLSRWVPAPAQPPLLHRHSPSLQDVYEKTHPMFVFPISTLLELDALLPFEAMAEARLLRSVDAGEAPGPIFFISHQWTSFSHPDPTGLQLSTLQHVFTTMAARGSANLFGCVCEWDDFANRDKMGYAMPYKPVTAEALAAEAAHGYVWIDYSCVPQAEAAAEQRAEAIRSIPHYIDEATTFVALCPRVEHSEVRGAFCDYHTWRRRGWCRLEEQANELKLANYSNGANGRSGTHLDAPRRPLVVHSPTHVTTTSIWDHFYVLGQRANSIYTGEFTCCTLGHRRQLPDGSSVRIECDKERIRPLVAGMWRRKIEHMRQGDPAVAHCIAWRYVSHQHLMLAETAEDSAENSDDPSLRNLADVLHKHRLTDPLALPTIVGFTQQFVASIDPTIPQWRDADGATRLADMKRRCERWAEVLSAPATGAVQVALMYMVAEGNLPMVKLLIERHGADPTLGVTWGTMTYVDYAAGKGHARVLAYLLSLPQCAAQVNRPSSRAGITAIDRAAKAGFVEGMRMLIAAGADIKAAVRLDGQTPAHGAAALGHVEVLRELAALGCDLDSADDEGCTPLDLARYYQQTDATLWLECRLGVCSDLSGCRDFLQACARLNCEPAAEGARVPHAASIVTATLVPPSSALCSSEAC